MAGSDAADKWNLRFFVFLKWSNPTRVCQCQRTLFKRERIDEQRKWMSVLYPTRRVSVAPQTINNNNHKILFLAIAIDEEINLFKFIQRRTLSLRLTIELFRTQKKNETEKQFFIGFVRHRTAVVVFVQQLNTKHTKCILISVAALNFLANIP